MSVYVLTAIEDGQVKRQEVYSDHTLAWLMFEELRKAYGAANVCFASRAVLEFPPEPINVEPEPVPDWHGVRGGRWA